MKAISTFKVGQAQYTFEIDEKDPMDTLNQIITLSNPPMWCQACGNREYFKLDSNKDKEGNTYVNMVCNTKCGAKAKLGQYKVGGFFWHKFEVYQKKETIDESY